MNRLERNITNAHSSPPKFPKQKFSAVAGLLEVSLYLLYQDGPFRLLVHSVRVVRVPEKSTHPEIPLTRECMHGLAKRTIKYGVRVWNKDYKELCEDMYASALRTIAAGAPDANHRTGGRGV